MAGAVCKDFQKDRLSQSAAVVDSSQLASMVDVSPATIGKWRAGTQAPSVTRLNALLAWSTSRRMVTRVRPGRSCPAAFSQQRVGASLHEPYLRPALSGFGTMAAALMITLTPRCQFALSRLHRAGTDH